MSEIIQPTETLIPQVEPKKNNLPLILGGAVAILILVAASVYAGMKIGEKKSQGSSVTPGLIINNNLPTSQAGLITCGSCPQFMPRSPDSCLDGIIVPGEKNECGCQMPPTCDKTTANWKIYTNKEFYFELKYPQNWSFTSEGPNAAMVDQQNGQTISGTTRPSYNTIIFSDMNKNKQFSIGIFEPYKYELSPEQYEKGYVYMNGSCDLRWGFTPRKVKTVTLDTLQVLRAEGITGSTIDQNSPKYDITCYYVKNKKGNLIVLNALPTPTSSNFTLYDQILSTFKFLPATNTNSESDKKTLVDYLKAKLAQELNPKGVPDDIVVNVQKIEGDFATGTYGLTRLDGGGGAVWIAKKIDGKWSQIWGGQEVPLCSDIGKYEVPSSITSCY